MNVRRVCMLAAAVLCSGSLLIASAADQPELKASPASVKDALISGPTNPEQAGATLDSFANTTAAGKVAPGNTTRGNPRLVNTNQGTQVPWTPATPSHGFAYGARGVGFDGSPGTDAPPALLSGFPMTPFPTDPRPTGTVVTDIAVPAPCTGVIAIDSSIPITRRAIGDGWNSWSHGYTGDVYTFYEDPGTVTLTMPADVCGIYFYVEPNTYDFFDITCVANLGLATEVSSGPISATGEAGAHYFGFFASAPDHIETVTITVDTAANGWAIGEFGIACGAECVVAPVACCFEATATCHDSYDLTQCIAEGGRYTLGVEYCADLDPACGALIGACCAGPDAEVYEPYQCIGDMTQVECFALPEEDTNWTYGESCEATPPFDCNEPTYCDVSYSDCSDTPREVCENGGSPDDWIMNVTFAEINNTTVNEPCPGSYGDYTDLVAYVAYGVTYNLSVETCGEGSWSECTTAWIDWNGDKVFDNETERYDLGCGVNVVLDMDITVPPTAVPGFTRMRVIEAYSTAAADACAGGSYGETEDYTINISGEIPTGACCDPVTGVCADEVLATECLSPSQFSMDALCADAFPNCGNPGACCDDETGDCEEDVLELSCTGSRFVAGGLCADLDPTCGDVPWLFDFTPGFEAPPEHLYGCPMTPFPLDERPTGSDVNDIPWPCPTGGTLAFDIAMSHRRIGDGWMSWSHGYTGDVYFTNGAFSVTMTLQDCEPANCGMYFYVEPDPFEDHLFTVTVNGFWESEEFVANGEGMAAYAGVSGPGIETLTVASDVQFAIGEFGACCFCGEVYGSCCDPYTGICADNVEVRCCPSGHQWSQDSCANRVPACGNPGACCDITTGECQDNVYELNCEGGRFEAGGECEELEPPCGTPGACCIDETATCTIEFEANCEGRFLAGAVCGDGGTIPDPWVEIGQPACGDWTCGGILYAPSNDDNSGFRDAITAICGDTVDYFDPRAGTPTLEDIQDYCIVYTWVNNAYENAEGFGDVLADFVDNGGIVILGQWTTDTGQYNCLEGRIMTEAYCPITATSVSADSYVDGSGMDCIFTNVHSLTGDYFDQCEAVAGAVADGELAGGKLAAAWRADKKVFYIPGGAAPDLTSGDLAQLIANVRICSAGGMGACCDPTTGTCTDDVEVADCAGQFALNGTCAVDYPNCGDRGACCNVYDGTCAEEVLALDCPADYRHEPGGECDELEPECGTPGACCVDETATCTIEFQANCEGRFLPGAVCGDGGTIPDPWVELGQPACGDWTCGGILYAPSYDDSATFRADIASICGDTVDYLDPRTESPTLADIQDYCIVFTWVNNAYLDSEGFGNVLADYVDGGGTVILGQWTYNTGQYNWLEGRIMTEAYCPITASSVGADSYVAGSGTDCIFTAVNSITGNYFDQCTAVAGAVSDGQLAGGNLAAAWRADKKVYYIPGGAGPAVTSGDMAELIAYIRVCAGGGSGACCDPITGICEDDVDVMACDGQFALDGTCAADFPNCGEYECPTQAPNQTNGIFSDVACDACGSGQQFMAENFVIPEGKEIEIDAIGFWGGYHPGNESIDDAFTMVIRSDDGSGLPGTAILNLGPMAATTKATTGVELFGVDEYVYTIDLEPNLTLTSGMYWVEIYNDTTATTDSWFWEVGDLDAEAGSAGHASTFTMPEEPWTFAGDDDMALEVICVSGKFSPKVDDRRLDRRRDSRRTLDVSPVATPSFQFGTSRR